MTVEVTKLDNGLVVATDPMPHLESVSLGVWVGCGARHERPSEMGLSHFLEHMAFKGTRRRSAKDIATGAWPFHATFFSTLALQRHIEPHTSTARQFTERNFVLGQSADGSWTDNFEGRQIGRVYCTSLAVLSLYYMFFLKLVWLPWLRRR